MRPILVALILGVTASLVGACVEEYDSSKECGRLGSCCWSDKTCNPNERPPVVCDTKTMKCVLDKTKLDSGPAIDQGPTPDTKATDAKVTDAKVPDAKVTDAKVTDAKTPDAKTPDAKVAD